MTTPRYILAKYAPDLGRMEPRNIGVIAWLKGVFAARFLDVSAVGEVGIKDFDTYKRWVTFWSRRISETDIRPRRGKPVPSVDPNSIDALVSTQKGNYLLVDSGELLNPTRKADLPSVVTYLFNDLVATKSHHARTAKITMESTCSKLLEQTGVPFKSNHPVECAWRGITRKLHPDYFIGNGKAHAIFQRTQLSSERSINSGALLIDAILNVGVVQPESCRFFVRLRDITTPDAEAGLKLLGRMCGYVDIDSSTAIDEVRGVVAVPSSQAAT